MPRPAADTQIEIDSTQLYLIAFVVLFALPLAFAVDRHRRLVAPAQRALMLQRQR